MLLRPPFGRVRLGDLRRLSPVSRRFGFDRGSPIDRYYIDAFLSSHSQDIRGRVLEIGDDRYARKYGAGRITRTEVLHVEEGNPQATIVADLTRADHVPSDAFDCIIFTEVLEHVYDVPAVIRTLYRILRPGGVVLATFNGISQISRGDMNRWGDYWRFTNLSASRLFGEVFPRGHLTVVSFGNVLAAVAFLHGLAAEELTRAELDYRDPEYQVTIAVRADKPRAESEAVGSPDASRGR